MVTGALARRHHDVTLAMTLFGYLPPLRVSCVGALTVPGGDSCEDADCSDAACRGNRLTRGAGGALGIHLAHHKTEGLSGRPLVLASLHEELGAQLAQYLQHCRPVLALPHSPGNVFLSATGRALSPAAFSVYWQSRVLPQLGLGHLRFPPRTLRHIWVDERLGALEQAGRAGPSDEDAALCMGNSVRTWHSRYHLDRDRAKLRRCVAAMPAWRERQLQQP